MSSTNATERPEPPVQTPVPTILRCADCGHTHQGTSAETTPRCPRCGSVRCERTERRVASSTVSAKQSLQEDRFVRTALWGDLITSEQFAECVETQKALAAAGENIPSVAELLVDKGYLRRDHAAAIHKVMTTRTPDEWRNQFGQLALRKGIVTDRRLRECLEFQTKLVVSSGSAPFLGHLLIERGYITEAQAFAILKAQEQHRIGILAELEGSLRPRSGRLIALLRTHPRVVLAVLFVAGIVAAGFLGAWIHAHASAPPTFDLICDNCGHRISAPASAIAQPCPRCGAGQLCTPLWCARCRAAFPLRVHASEGQPSWIEPCPNCGTLEHTELPPGLDRLAVKPPPKAP